MFGHPLHPMIVHFPIALLLTSVLFDAISNFFKRDSLREGALWLLGLGLLGGVAASIAGSMAEEAAEKAGIAESLIETHESLAFVTMGIFGLLFLWRLFLRKQFAGRLLAIYLLGATIGVGTLSATGYYGGDLVYEHGAGVNVASHGTPTIATKQDDN
jgi:uncharacterized membrane protein